jgi:CRISPR-associated endonuclease/helicase Cas3
LTSFFAHSGRNADKSDWQPLREHLAAVANLAKQRALAVSPSNEALATAAYAAGLLHDLGKYRDGFQRHIRDEPVARIDTYHKQCGAAKAFKLRHGPVAFAIAGHHGGLTNLEECKQHVSGNAGFATLEALWPIAIEDCKPLGSLTLPEFGGDALHADLVTRVIFSCLVDADWTDTGEHQRRVAGEVESPVVPVLQAAAWLERVLKHIGICASNSCEPMKSIRAEILQACLAAAELPPGLFSLTVPTGGGKTLSGLAFALKHAALQNLRRVIYVAPYLSILDQNARTIRQALGFGPDRQELFEHHSLAEPGFGEENETARDAVIRRAENWQSPIIVTTSVQFFESLFANAPGRCRKLHNIAGSVVLLDECQTLPPDLVAPTCSMLNQFSANLGCSLVLCTATQPAFDHPDLDERLTGVREIIPESLQLSKRLKRVELAWPKRNERPLEWPDIATQMRQEKQCLCIVNTRRAARELFLQLKQNGGDVFHLSTSMCPAHRLAILDQARARLQAGARCYLVSTQLIEAGVDIDFPKVFRELAPLEAVIQAAGRCNREGKLAKGEVVVFKSAEGKLPPDRWYRAGRAVLVDNFLTAGRAPAIDDPATINEYFERLYRTGGLDALGIQPARKRLEFATVSQLYRLIDNDGIPAVVATWDDHAANVDALLHAVKTAPLRTNFRHLAAYQINLRYYELDKAGGAVTEESPGLWVWRGGYDNDVGVTPEQGDRLLLV